MSRVRWAATIGLATSLVGVVCALLPFVAALEESVGLPALFLTRGAIRPAEQVAIVSLDEAAAARMGLPPLVRDWPRSAHAALVDRLLEQGASAIAFDVEFFRHGDADADEAFARAAARSRRVVLIQHLELPRIAAAITGSCGIDSAVG